MKKHHVKPLLVAHKKWIPFSFYLRKFVQHSVKLYGLSGLV